MAINPLRSTPSGRQALADVLMQIREQAECGNWDEFAKALEGAGLEISAKNLETYAPTPRYANAPAAALFYAIGSWGVFTFKNGEVITSENLYEVLLGLRSASGVLLERNARNP